MQAGGEAWRAGVGRPRVGLTARRAGWAAQGYPLITDRMGGGMRHFGHSVEVADGSGGLGWKV
jgi:hypothetical protein